MRLADWDAATTAYFRSLWERANAAANVTDVELYPGESRALGGENTASASRSSFHKRSRWRVFFRLADLLSTHPPLLGPEKVLRRAVREECAAIGQPLPEPKWQVLTRQRLEPIYPSPPEHGLRETWISVDAAASEIESKHGPITRLTPILDRLRAESPLSLDVLRELWYEVVKLMQTEPANPVPVSIIKYFDGEKNRAKAYQQFELPKRRGGTRTIAVPSRSLKWLQRSVLQVLTHLFPRHKCAVGFERGESIVTHARAHAGKRFVYVVDIKEFFPSITRERIFGMLRAFPFNASEDVARYLANLCTYEGTLPQGAPTSPILANLLCRRMDARLFKWARERGYEYTRYADDLAFSTNRSNFPKADREQIQQIIEDEGFAVHPRKQKLMPWYGRQLVTGLVVNEKTNVPRDYIRSLRAILFNVETFGWASQVGRSELHQNDASWMMYKLRKLPLEDFQKIAKAQSAERMLMRPGSEIRTAKNVRSLQRVLRGRIEFVGAVRGKDDSVYLRLLAKFESLVGRESKFAAEETKGRRTFQPAEVEDVGESRGNYAEVMKILRGLERAEKSDSDLFEWLDKKSRWSLEAEWLFKEFASLAADERRRKVRALAHQLDTHPNITREFFHQFSIGKPFRRLLHAPVSKADASGRFEFEEGERMSAGEIVGACEAVLDKYPLPDALRVETTKLLKDCRSWLEAHPTEHPFLSDALQDRLQTYKKEVRFDDEPGTTFSDRLQKEVDELKETGGNVVLDELPPVFYTYTPSTVKAIRIILRSLVEKSLKKAKDGVAEPVHVEATYERIGETEQAVVVLQAHDGPVNVEEGLHNLLRGDTQSALFLLRGFARWKMEVPFADGVVRAYEVTRKAKIEPENSELPGFRHVLTFYQ